MRKVDNPECKVISLIVDADTERCVLPVLIFVTRQHTSVDDVEVSVSCNSGG